MVQRASAVLLSLFALGCSALIEGRPPDPGEEPPEKPPPDPPAALTILAPFAGEIFDREAFDSQFAFITEPIVFLSAALDPAIVEVEYLTEFDFSLGVGVAPDFEVTSPFRIDGLRTVTAHGRDADGVEIATAQVQFSVTPPIDELCLDRLSLAGVSFTVEEPTLGIHTPIRFQSPLGGITYIPFGASGPRPNGELASCALAETLLLIGPSLSARGITAVEHIGIYNFRCIGGGDPSTDDCNPSQHAFATGIDLHELRAADGTTYNVETDFVIDADGQTCSAATSDTKDALLHEVACDDLFGPEDRFHIVLTPNYNSAHRNHFHVDLTPGSDFIRALLDVDAPRGAGPVGH